ncbi:MAG: type III sulfide quinone reductase, selenoprotein subtype, partial [Candidatus Nanopelagicales bacterium]
MLPAGDWRIAVVDADDHHRYQPGFLFMPFGTYRPDQVTQSRRKVLSKGIPLIYGEIDRVVADEKAVHLADGTRLDYDMLIIATGVTPRPEQTPGMLSDEWGVSVHEFYSYEG